MLKDQEGLRQSSFLSEGAMKERLVRPSWRPVTNTAAVSIAKPDRDFETARYLFTDRLLASHMEVDDSHIAFARRRAALEVWVKMIDTMLVSDCSGLEKLCVPVTNGQFPLKGRD